MKRRSRARRWRLSDARRRWVFDRWLAVCTEILRAADLVFPGGIEIRPPSFRFVRVNYDRPAHEFDHRVTFTPE